MLVSPTMQRPLTATPRPRRLPAHLSVSLRHGSTSSNSQSVEVGGSGPNKVIPSRQESEGSGQSGESNVQKWFDHSNARPETGYNQNFDDSYDPPYVLTHDSASTSNNGGSASRPAQENCFMPSMQPAVTNGSCADDFRSVIDDLTIENRKLKERLRKYERTQPSHLNKDKMFELKIHDLPSRKRRELEEVLREFVSSVDGSIDEETRFSNKDRRPPSSLLKHRNSSSTSNTKNTPSSSTSNSRPVDSAYASMSTSEPTSISTLNRTNAEIKARSQPQVAKEQKIQSFLHNIPEGLLPKHTPIMTDRQKKRLVVLRLEQLFTGKRGVKAGENSQPLQQQEVSNSAARADQAAKNGPLEEEGSREAFILPMDVDVEAGKPAKLQVESSAATTDIPISVSSDGSPGPQSPKQRPTRPLDLDPDRAQIPSENVEYIRHLGLPTPQLVTQDSSDVTTDAQGWIYLNLLINMAQLHIVNVTPEFVRSALSMVSEKFQISPDGKKVRWRGGSEGTHLSSDSGASSAHHRSPPEIEIDSFSRKRRKVEAGNFTVDSVKTDVPQAPAIPTQLASAFHYKPLFHRQASSSNDMTSTDGGDSVCSELEHESSSRMQSSNGNAHSGVPQFVGKARRQRDAGPMVFYNGANFCTDLSGDRGNIITPLHVSGIGRDGYSNQAEGALGSKRQSQPPAYHRTTSGSLLPFRPFKGYSIGNDPFRTEENRPKTPEPDNDPFVHEPPLEPGPEYQPQGFEASGLCGIQPTDHFTVRVETRRKRTEGSHLASVTKSLRLSPLNKTPRKFLHGIPQKSLDSFHAPSPEESITKRLAGLAGFSSPPRKPVVSDEERPIKTHIISTEYISLEPSQLPEPFGWDLTLSSSDEGSDADSSSTGISHLRRDRTFLHESHGSFDGRENTTNDVDVADRSSTDMITEDDTDDGSIDMLAQARQLDPYVVAEQERMFAMEADGGEADAIDKGGAMLVRSSAATIDDESDYSSIMSMAG